MENDPKASYLGAEQLLTPFILAKYCGARVGIESGEWVGSVVGSGQVNFGGLQETHERASRRQFELEA